LRELRTRKMGNGSSSDTVKVRAARDLEPNQQFKAGAKGVLWIDLRAPKTGTKKHDITYAIIDQDTKIQSYAKSNAEKGKHFEVGMTRTNARYTYKFTATKTITKGEKVTLLYKDLVGKAEVKLFCDNLDLIPAPDKDKTGVEPSITNICASLSDQIYVAKHERDFILQPIPGPHGLRGRMIIFDRHGKSNDAIPAFAVAVYEDTMIMGWRGTNTSGTAVNTTLDFISDAAMGPVVCSELGEARHGIRVHNAMSSFAASDLDTHKDAILEEIGKGIVKEVVLTGHSLGGGIACIAHHIVQAQISGYFKSHDDGSYEVGSEGNEPKTKREWTDFNYIQAKSVVFSAPMSLNYNVDKDNEFTKSKVVIKDNVFTKDNTFTKSNALIKEVGNNTVNLFYGCDLVPRLLSHLAYFPDILDKVGSEIKELINRKTPPMIGSLFNKLLNIDDKVNELNKIGIDLVPVVENFRHTGKLIYYKDKGSAPITLKDTGPPRKLEMVNGRMTYEGDGIHALNNYPYLHHDRENNQTHIDALLDAHGFPKNLFASHIRTVDDLDSRVTDESAESMPSDVVDYNEV